MKWERADYDTDPVTLAKKLIGAVLCCRTKEGLTTGRIVECEAYGGCWRGHEDDGAHSAKGITARTKVIFGEPGHAYVYLIYGMYTCLNIVCEPEGIPGCVLIRAIEPLSGVELMRHRRKGAKGRLLTGGPGRLTMAMEEISRGAWCSKIIYMYLSKESSSREPRITSDPAIEPAFP